MKQLKISRPVYLIPSVTIFFAVWGSGCGLEAPPPSFVEKPRAFIHMSIEDDGEINDSEELLNQDNAVWNDEILNDTLLDEILSYYDQEEENHNESDIPPTPADNVPQQEAPSADAVMEGSSDLLPQQDLQLDAHDIETCARLHGVSSQQIIVTGKQDQLTLKTSSVVAARVSGNQTALDLVIDSKTPADLRGICLFATGSQTLINVRIENIMVDATYLLTRGNKSQIKIKFIESYSSLVLADMAGNQTVIEIEGLPDANCPQANVRMRGNQPQFHCL